MLWHGPVGYTPFGMPTSHVEVLLQVLGTLLLIQPPADVPVRRRRWLKVPATYVRELGRVLGFWLQPGSALIYGGLWGVNK